MYLLIQSPSLIISIFLEKEEKWNGSYFFIFGTDPQPGLVDLVDGGDGINTKECYRNDQFVVCSILMQLFNQSC